MPSIVTDESSLVDRLLAAARDLEVHGTGLNRYRYSMIIAAIREAAAQLSREEAQ